MGLDFIWWCSECEQEISSPEEHSQTYPTHTYIEKMRWAGDTITPIVPQAVKEHVDEDVLVVSGTLQIGIDEALVFGSDYQFSYNNKDISTTTTKYEKMHTLDFEITTAGKYRVSCFYQYRYYGKKGIGFQSRIVLDGEDIIFENGTSNFYLADEKDYIPINVFNYIDMSVGEHYLVLEASLRIPKDVKKRGSVGYIKDMKLELWRVE